tara:strand:+ start:80 stop:325 length:246 start_codon:yes stop_codon:yes gene_type:complete
MKTNFKMKEALNKDEAIISILDVIDHNPEWTSTISNSLFLLVKNMEKEHQQFLLEKSIDEQVIELFVDVKTAHDKFKYPTR